MSEPFICDDCQRVTSGDCGMHGHGPKVYPAMAPASISGVGQKLDLRCMEHPECRGIRAASDLLDDLSDHLSCEQGSRHDAERQVAALRSVLLNLIAALRPENRVQMVNMALVGAAIADAQSVLSSVEAAREARHAG